MPLVAILFLIGCGAAIKGAWDHVRTDARASRAAKVKAASKAAGGTLPKHQRSAVARRHTVGWWAREVGGGFPAARTGWHAGWIAHKTALERQRVIREEARTEHIETKAGFRKDLAEHQRRQTEARAELERELAAQRAKGGPATGKEAVQSAAATVADLDAKRAEKAREQAVPPLPADMVAREPVVIDTPTRVHHAEDSDWFTPGQPRCEGCGGSGRGPHGQGACPACRGFGSAPWDPASPLAAPDAICGACGNAGKPGDPVLATASGSNIHLSHAREQQEAYWEALNRMRQAEREPGPDASRNPEPVTGTGASGDADDYRYVECPDCGADVGQRCAPDCRYDPHEDRDASRNPQPIGSTPSNTEGEPVTADTNYTAVRNRSAALSAAADQDLATIRERKAQAMQQAEEMQGLGVNGETLSSAMDLVDHYTNLEAAAVRAGEGAGTVGSALQREHGGMKEAVDEAPVEPAEIGFYKGD